MNPNELFIFLIVLIFSTFSIQQDIKHRKVENSLTLFLFFISVIIFIFATPNLLLLDFFFLAISTIISYYIYKKDTWGGADGKIFISISFLLVSIQGYLGILNYTINLIIFYSFTMIIVSILKTSIKDKIKIIKIIDYKTNIFGIIIVFILISTLFKFIPKSLNPDINTLILFASFIFLMTISSKTKKYLNKFNENNKTLIIMFLFAILVIISNNQFLNYFFPLLFFKLFLEYSSKIVTKIKSKNNEYHSPFTTYLFLVALFTILLTESVLVIIVKFISYYH